MLEINPMIPVYPVAKPRKIDPKDEDSKNKKSSQNHAPLLSEPDDDRDSDSNPHIDEIV